MKTKCLFYLLLLLITFINKINSKIDPFSQISITSNKAICQKEKDSNFFTFTYLDDVLVTFSDQSQIKSDILDIQIQAQKIKNQEFKNKNFSFIKKISFKNNVLLKRENRTIQANTAHIYPEKKICRLIGNVEIKQEKKEIKDLPITTECEEAELDMQSEKITFLGSKQKPVNTTIKIAGHPGLLKKVKTKAEKKAVRKAAKRALRDARKKKI